MKTFLTITIRGGAGDGERMTFAQFAEDNKDGIAAEQLERMRDVLERRESYGLGGGAAPFCVLVPDKNRMTLRDVAAQARADKAGGIPTAGGWVIIWRGVAAGWVHALDNAGSWEPGVYAVPAEDSPVFVATGGDPERGAEKWERCDE